MPDLDDQRTMGPESDERAEADRSVGAAPTMGQAGGEEEAISMGSVPTRLDERRLRRFRTGDRILGRYRITGELGQGGMGVVYRCYDETGGVDIALKAIPPELSHNTIEMEDIRENYKLLVDADLSHPHIATLRNLELDPNTCDYYLIMQCAQGIDLRKYRRAQGKQGRLSLQQVIPIVKQVAQALDHAHSRRIIHRDIKPSNVMVAADGNVKVLDFGLASQIHTSLTRLSHVRYGTSGTGPYMAPEQWRGQRQDQATDQYALAVMIYELLAGICPFENQDVVILREAVLKEEPEAVPGLDSARWSVLCRALSKERQERFSSCATFINALETGTLGADTRLRRPTAGVVISDKEIEEGICPSCGYRNQTNAKFCVSCRTALFAECPKCRFEQRAGLTYCGGCGVEIEAYRQAIENVEIAQKRLDDHEPSKALKLCDSILAVAEDNKQAAKIRNEATRALEVAQQLREKADRLRNAGDFDAAVEKLQRVLDVDSDAQGAKPLISEIQKQAAAYGGAIRGARDAKNERRWQEVVSKAKEALAVHPRSDLAQSLLKEGTDTLAEIEGLRGEASLARQKHRFDIAATRYSHLTELDPSDADSKEALTKVQDTLRQIAQRVGTAEEAKARKLWSRVAEEAGAALLLDPDHEAATALRTEAGRTGARIDDMSKRAAELTKSEKYESAIEVIQEVLSLTGEGHDAFRQSIDRLHESIKKRDAEAALAQGNALLEQRRFPKAQKCFREVLAAYPNNVQAMTGSEKAQMQLDAISRMEQAGKELEEQGLLAEAQEKYQKALEISPYAPESIKRSAYLKKTIEQIESLKRQAGQLVQGGSYSAALDRWKQIKKLNPRDKEISDQTARIQALDVEARRRQRNRIIAVTSTVAALIAIAVIVDQSRKTILCNSNYRKAKAAASAEEWHTAKEFCNKALRYRPKNERVASLLATLPKLGALRIASDPTGAEVLIDDKRVGKTPHEIAWLPVGKRSLELKMAKCEPYKTDVSVVADKTATHETRLTGLPGTVKVATDPTGAQVWLNGELQSQTTPAELSNVRCGQVAINVEKDGYRPAEKTLELPPDGVISADFDPLVIKHGKVQIQTDPVGAEVYVDGEHKGKTPVTVGGVPEGDHKIAIKFAHYEAVESAPVSVQDARTEMKTYTLVPLPGILSVRSTPPGAEVIVDGRATGNTTPSDVQLPALKSALISAKLSGYGCENPTPVTLAPDGTGELVLRLVKKYGTLHVKTDPAGAQVFVDGKTMGQTSPRGLDIPEISFGSHTVLARMDGHKESATADIAITEEKQYPVNLILHPLPGQLTAVSFSILMSLG